MAIDRPKRAASAKANASIEANGSAKARKSASSTAAGKRARKGVHPKNEDAGTDVQEAAADGEDLIDALLSDEMYELAYPRIDPGHGEKDLPAEQRAKPLPKEKAGQMKADTKDSRSTDQATGKQRGFSSKDLTPFEELLCAAMLSKPLSHRLGLRTIATLFSPPFGLNTPSALEKAGLEGRREVMYEARTQHKEKTASQLGDLVQGLRTVCGEQEADMISLRAVREAAQEAARQTSDGQAHERAIDSVRSQLTANVKGLGDTGVDIFLRRIQGHNGWQVLYPFIDGRAAEAGHKLGLLEPHNDTKSAGRQLAQHFASRSRADFVRLLDVLVGLGFRDDLDSIKNKLVAC